MSTYFETLLPNGSIQISDQNINFLLGSKTRLGDYYKNSYALKLKTFDGYVNFNGTAYCYAIPSSDNMRFICNPYSVEVGLITKTLLLTQWTNASKHTFYGMYDVVVVFNTTKDIADSLMVFEYKKTDAVDSTQNYGLECYNSEGKLCFTSSKAPLKILTSVIEQNVPPDTKVESVHFATQTFTDVNLTYSDKRIGFWSPYANMGGAGRQAQGYAKAPISFLSQNSLKMRLVRYNDTNISMVYNSPNYIQDAFMGTNSYATAYTVVDLTNC